MSPALLQILLALVQILPRLVTEISKALQQSGEWSEAEAAKFRADMEAALAQAHWQPRPPGGEL